MIHYDSKARAFGFASFIFMMAVLSLSSCREFDDENQSMALSGQWRGDFGMYYDYNDGHGGRHRFNSYDTRLTFTPAYSYANYGSGTQVDYYEYGPYEYQWYRFRWEVRYGLIYLTYEYDHELDTRIRNYHMTNDYFSGTFSESGTAFRLYKITDYYDWTPYVNIYGYGSRYDWDYGYPYYAPATRSEVEAPSDSIPNEGKILRMGRRQELKQ